MATLAELWPQLVAALHSYLRGANWRELLITAADILIVYYAIYRVLRLIRGTRAAQMLVGMLLVALIYVAAKYLQLTTVSWLFENLLNYAIIFLIVIFQHDIRRGLMQVGQNLYRGRQYEESYVIEEVVQAADHLARHRIGGLIVLEREAALADYLGEAGVELDARVTKELLVTLFIPEPENHMHDGAVIIKNLRLQQAGAVLPLSANARLDKQLGTRHRAAIGITEETDAVVVVISEERGAISLCFNGNIANGLPAATLRKALLSLFQKKPKQKAKPEPFLGLPAWWRFWQRRTPHNSDKDDKQDKAETPAAVAAAAAAALAATVRPDESTRPSGKSPPPPSAEGGDKERPRPHGVPLRDLPAEVLSLVMTQPMSRPRDAAAAAERTASEGAVVAEAAEPGDGGAAAPSATTTS